MVTVSDVEALSSTGWKQALEPTQKSALLEIAKNEAGDLYGGRVSTLSEQEGNRDDFVKWLAAHKFELATGGEAQNEGSQGGSVNYNTVTGDPMNSLTETRYGRVALEYLRQGQSISFVVS